MFGSYAFDHDEEVTVVYPATPRYPRGRVADGVIARRSTINGGRRCYTVLFTDDSADTLIPEHWIRRRGQVTMPI